MGFTPSVPLMREVRASVVFASVGVTPSHPDTNTLQIYRGFGRYKLKNIFSNGYRKINVRN